MLSPLLTTPEEEQVLRDVVRAIRNARGAGGVSVLYSPGAGLVITGGKVGPKKNAGTLIKRMVVKTVEDDYLVCRALDADDNEGPTDINVAKPPELRQDKDYYPNVTVLTSVDEQEVTVTVSGSAETWILPSELEYVATETQILAVRCGKTGVQTTGGSSEDITWMDLNNAGRVWIKDES